MNKPGFSVIELMISIMISAILMTAALAIYNQISRGATSVQRTTQQDTTATIVKNRLSQDLLGLCPLWFPKQPEQENHDEAKSDLPQPLEPKSQPTAQKDPNIEQNNYFYAVNNDNQLKFLTFVTTSALQTYTQQQYRCIRVVYALKPDQHNPGLYLLQRKEDHKVSNQFNIEEILKGEFYTVAKNITECFLEYGFIDMSPQERAKNPDKPWKTTWVKQWGTKQNAQQPDSNEKYKPTMPDIVRIKITLQEIKNGPTKEYELQCMIPQSSNVTLKSFAQQRKEKQPKNAKEQPKEPPKDNTPSAKGDAQPSDTDTITTNPKAT